MTSQVHYNVSQAFCPSDQYPVRDIDYAKPTIKDIMNDAIENRIIRAMRAGLLSTTVPHVVNAVGKTIYNSCIARDGYCNQGLAAVTTAIDESRKNGWLKTVEDYAAPLLLSVGTVVDDVVDYVKANPISSVIMIFTTGLLGGAIAERRGYSDKVVEEVVCLSVFVPLPVLNYVGKTISNSCTAQGGYCNDVITSVVDYVQANPITTAASAIAGIAGSVLGPLYSQTAITQAGIKAFNAVMIATITAAAQNRAVTRPIIQAAYAAANKVRSATVLGQTLGRGLVSGLGTAIVPHVLNYVAKQLVTAVLPKTDIAIEELLQFLKLG